MEILILLGALGVGGVMIWRHMRRNPGEDVDENAIENLTFVAEKLEVAAKSRSRWTSDDSGGEGGGGDGG
jgi:hypothetical protein